MHICVLVYVNSKLITRVRVRQSIACNGQKRFNNIQHIDKISINQQLLFNYVRKFHWRRPLDSIRRLLNFKCG